MRFITTVLLAGGVLAGLSTEVAAQRHATTDAAIAGSLLTAVPLPLSAGAWVTDTLWLDQVVRVDVQYSRLARGEVAGARTILGIRWDAPQSDTLGWSALTSGLRVAVTRNEDGRATPSALELHVGGRSLGYLEREGWPDVGFDALFGLSRLDAPDVDFTVAFRVPAEWVLPAGPGRVLLSLVPTVAWGDVHIEGCVDDGPGDNCGDLGVQLEPGRTRFLLAGGLGIAVPPAGLTVSLGATQLLALGQRPRLALGLAWGY